MKLPLAAVLLAGGLLTACDEPDLDCYESLDGCEGTAPDPSATVHGTLAYRGPRPSCSQNDDGELVPIGNAYLIMWQYRFQRAPKGEGSAPHDILAIPGTTLFGALREDECLPRGATEADRAVLIERLVPFRWPSVQLEVGETMEVVIEGFYDHDDDYHPLFSVRLSPTRGDVWGGAISQSRLEVFGFAPRFSRPSQSLRGVVVALEHLVNTEVPIFRIDDEARPLSSETVIPFSETEMFELMNLRVSLVLDPPAEYVSAFEAAGLRSIETGPTAASWFIRGFDYNDEEGNVGPDGMPDEHPGTVHRDDVAALWRFPVASMQREYTDEEEEFDVELVPEGQSTVQDFPIIPEVVLLPFLRADEAIAARARRPDVALTTLPAAVMFLRPGDLECRVLIVPPGNAGESFIEPDMQAWCHELPTGRYQLSMQNGVAGGTLFETVPERSEACDEMGVCYLYQDAMGTSTGFDIAQLWAIPNELGERDEIGPAAIPAEQGVEAALVIADPNPNDPPVQCARNDEGQQIDLFDRPIETEMVSTACCEFVSQLCDLPLCEARAITMDDPSVESYFESGRPAEQGAYIRALGPEDVDQFGRPLCKPFAIPPPCCPIE